jgi:AcrR family transcriptional regulator
MRHEALIKATLAQLREVGFDSTKIQDIAERAGVALATAYRYFGSRDRLIFEAASRWLTEVIAEGAPLLADQPFEQRIIGTVSRNTAEFIKEPKILEALARVNLTREASPAERQSGVDQLLFPPDIMESDPELIEDLYRMVDHVFFAGIVRWALGQQSYDEVCRSVERAVVLTLQAHRRSSFLNEPK